MTPNASTQGKLATTEDLDAILDVLGREAKDAARSIALASPDAKNLALNLAADLILSLIHI